MTAFTTASAFMNMLQGERSRGKTAVPSTDGTRSCALATQGKRPSTAIPQAHAVAEAGRQAPKCFRWVDDISVPQPCKQSSAGAGQQHLIFGV